MHFPGCFSDIWNNRLISTIQTQSCYSSPFNLKSLIICQFRFKKVTRIFGGNTAPLIVAIRFLNWTLEMEIYTFVLCCTILTSVESFTTPSRIVYESKSDSSLGSKGKVFLKVRAAAAQVLLPPEAVPEIHPVGDGGITVI